jgi:hypothetical protein
LTDVAKRHFNSDLEQIAVSAVKDENPNVVITAITILGQYGSTNVEKSLWQSFEARLQRWQGRARELNAQTFTDSSLQQQKNIESAFAQALSTSSAWLATLEKLKQIAALCVTQQGKDELQGFATWWKTEIEVEYNPEADTWGTARVAQYQLHSLAQLKQKLAPFPSGTTFKWIGDPASHKQLQSVCDEVKLFVEEKGMQLVR